MKKIRSRSLTWAELDARLGARPAAHWRYYLRALGLPELELQAGGASFADYLPVEALLADALASPKGDIRSCAECGEAFDIDRAEGIFADLQALEGWVCAGCARKLTAYDFFHKHMAGRA
jgi:hypothetical protein